MTSSCSNQDGYNPFQTIWLHLDFTAELFPSRLSLLHERAWYRGPCSQLCGNRTNCAIQWGKGIFYTGMIRAIICQFLYCLQGLQEALTNLLIVSVCVLYNSKRFMCTPKKVNVPLEALWNMPCDVCLLFVLIPCRQEAPFHSIGLRGPTWSTNQRHNSARIWVM